MADEKEKVEKKEFKKEVKKEYTLTDLPGIGPAVSAKLELAGVYDLMTDRKSTRLNSSHTDISRMPSSA